MARVGGFDINPKKSFVQRVWGALLVEDKELYAMAKAVAEQLNELIEQGYDAGWDEESIIEFIKESVRD